MFFYKTYAVQLRDSNTTSRGFKKLCDRASCVGRAPFRTRLVSGWEFQCVAMPTMDFRLSRPLKSARMATTQA